MDKDQSKKINHDDIVHILDMLERGDFDELELRANGLEVIVRRGASGHTDSPAPHVSPEPVHARMDESRTPPKSAAPETGAEKAELQKLDFQAMPGQEEGLAPIKAPMLGTFYAAKSPGAPPFVTVGQEVAENDVVCIIEIMKLMNSVTAGVRGRIAKVLVENGKLVEYQQPLFLVEQMGR
ncbi:MAG: acetyl-CoA carboxylase biotin carboxyl carrier protein [Desulfobacteraceae bacterium]|nr:MAG: acetyl-CoA carboxylase biotin carboxyl carrier protein [Desulfobacteraceae bacterium]